MISVLPVTGPAWVIAIFEVVVGAQKAPPQAFSPGAGAPRGQERIPLRLNRNAL